MCLADEVSDTKTIHEMFESWFRAEKGPCVMMDAVGLDTVYSIEVVHQEQLGLNPKAKDWRKAAFVDKGNLENKSGEGLLSSTKMVNCSAEMSFGVTSGFELSTGCTYRSKVYMERTKTKITLRPNGLLQACKSKIRMLGIHSQQKDKTRNI